MLEMNQGWDYFANFTLALFEYTKSSEQINKKWNRLIDNNTSNKIIKKKIIIIGFRLPGV